VISSKTTSSTSSGKTAGISLLKKKVSAPAPSLVTSSVLTAPQIILPPPLPPRPTVATSFLAGSKLSDEWFLGTVMIDMAIIGYESIGPVIIHDLSTKKRPKDGILSGAGAGCMFETGVPIPVANAADSDEVVFEKWKNYGHQVQSSRKVIRSAVEDLLAGIMPTPFELPPSIPLGPFASAVSINPSCCSCTSLAHQIETIGLEKRKGSCGPLGQLLSEASMSLERIRAKANDKHWPVPSGAVGMIGPAGQNMDGAILLKQLRKLNPNLPITAEMCGVTGGAGQNIDASILLKRLRKLYPDLIVTAEMCGMTGGAGQNIDASITLQEYRAHDPDLVITAEMVNMTGASGRSMDASNMLHARRRESPDEVFSAADVGMPGASGRSMDASNKLHARRRESPGQAVSAADVGMPGATGISMDAALHNVGLPLMRRDPSQYTGFARKNLEDQQAQHRNLIARGVLFSVDGNVCTPCEAHQFLELELKNQNSNSASHWASHSLYRAVECMGKPGDAKFFKVCSKHATSTSPGVKGFDIYAYYPPPALSSAQSASSSIDSNVVQEPVRPSAFSLLKPSTGAPLKRTVGRVRNDNAKCPWPGCTLPPFSRTLNMTRHFNSHTEGSTEVKSGGASHKKNLKK
jgi:hypothetical protein